MATVGNLGHWEDLAAFHGTGDDSYYDIPALVRGDLTLRGLEADAVEAATDGRGVKGLDVAHVQSHIGIDSVHLARLGARVTGLPDASKPVSTRASPTCGTMVLTGWSSSSLPCSTSCIAAVAVTALVIEAIRKTLSMRKGVAPSGPV